MKAKRKKGCRRRARELIGVNWLLLFWPEPGQGEESLRVGGGGCNYKETRATRRRGERISSGSVKGRAGVRWRENKESWQVHTHCATHIFHTCSTAACFTHNYKYESLPTVWKWSAEQIGRNDGEEKRWKKCVTCSSRKERGSVWKDSEHEGVFFFGEGGWTVVNVHQVP